MASAEAFKTNIAPTRPPPTLRPCRYKKPLSLDRGFCMFNADVLCPRHPAQRSYGQHRCRYSCD